MINTMYPKAMKNNRPKQSLSLRKALLLSVFLHGLVFWLLTLLVKTHTLPEATVPCLSFDLVAEPGNVVTATQEKRDTHSIHPPMAHQKLASRNECLRQQLSTLKESVRPASPSFKSISMGTLLPLPVNTPRMKMVEPKLIPPIKPMSQQQQQFLLRKAQELTEKFTELNRPDSLLVWQDKNHRYRVKLFHKPRQGLTGLDEIVIEITTRDSEDVLSCEIQMRRMAFSSFAQFVDYWHPHVAIHNDEFRGRVHSNTSITITRRQGILPKFYGKVTTASYGVRADKRLLLLEPHTVFLGGLERGVKEIRLPKSLFPFSDNTVIDSSHIHFLNEDTRITFYSDGSYGWRTASPYDTLRRRYIPSAEPFFIIGGENANIHVKGIVNGEVLVYSSQNILIEDDLLYASHPERNFLSDDYLGLISEKDVIIAEPAVIGKRDLHINAVIFARRKFCVSQYNVPIRKVLYLYGSLAAGTLTATEPRYATRITFDPRLEKRRPPYFPLTDHYEVVKWDKQWKIIEKQKAS